MNAPYMNVTEGYSLYDTVIVCSELFGKEKSINGWYTTFTDFANDEKHTFFKSRTSGNSHLAYCNMDSADTVDFVFKAFSLGVRFFAPVMPDCLNTIIVSPTEMNDNVPAFWTFDLAKHCGIDFRVQQDVIVENTCLATPAGYGPRGGGGAQPSIDDNPNPDFPNQTPWQVTVGSNGEPCIDNRFPFPSPVSIARNTSIEANIYLSGYARWVLSNIGGPNLWVLPSEEQATQPQGDDDYITMSTRYGIQVSLYGYREVQQRGQYHAPGAIQEG